MRILNLMENTEGAAGCVPAHGLSFYVETAGHELLLDLGPSEQTLRNAEILGVDLRSVDTVVLSHGHYDHSGGILPFAQLNDKAVIYMQDAAPGEYYADDGEAAAERYRYIGIDPKIRTLPQVRLLQGDAVIGDGLELFTIRDRTHALPSANGRLLVKTPEGYRRDDFSHEHFLVIRENGRSVLLSGCAHNGILSIMDAYEKRYGTAPDLVVSGFHLMKKSEYSDAEIAEIRNIALELLRYPCRYVTCHCTGTVAFDVMKEILGERLQYVHCGEEVRV